MANPFTASAGRSPGAVKPTHQVSCLEWKPSRRWTAWKMVDGSSLWMGEGGKKRSRAKTGRRPRTGTCPRPCRSRACWMANPFTASAGRSPGAFKPTDQVSCLEWKPSRWWTAWKMVDGSGAPQIRSVSTITKGVIDDATLVLPLPWYGRSVKSY